MTKSVAELIRADADEQADLRPAAEPVQTAEASIPPPTPTEPLQRGLAALRQHNLDPLRLWTVKAPKDTGGLIMGVFLQATSEVIVMHQLASGRFVLFAKTAIEALGASDE